MCWGFTTFSHQPPNPKIKLSQTTRSNVSLSPKIPLTGKSQLVTTHLVRSPRVGHYTHCDKCEAEFANMLRQHTRLAFVEPATFMASGWTGPAEYRTLWDDFQLWMYGLAAQAMKDELVAYTKKRDADARVLFLQSAHPCRPRHKFAYLTTQKAFDFEGMQAYIYCYHAGYQGSPKKVGDLLQERLDRGQKNLQFRYLIQRLLD